MGGNIKRPFNRREAEAGCFILLYSQPRSRGISDTTTELKRNNHYTLCIGNYTKSLGPASWFLTTNHEVTGSIPGSTMGIFSLIGEDPHGDHGLGS
jgi:hypothetical protein